MSDELFERDLRSVLSSLEPKDTPLSLQRAVAGAQGAARSRRRLVGRLYPWPEGWLDRLVSGAVGFGGLSVVALVVVVLLISTGALPTGPGQGAGGMPAIRWDTPYVTFEAKSVLIEAGGRQFVGPAKPPTVRSDPGSSDYRTLEIEWRDQGIEMRLNLYFAATDAEWWVSEIRTYDGGTPGDWITWRGEFLRSTLGSSWTGDVSLSGGQGRTAGALHIDDLRLTAFEPGTAHRFEDCTARGPIRGPFDVGPVGAPLDQPFADTGVRKGMTAAAAHAMLNELGICHEFRLDYDNVLSQRWCVPPPGKVESSAYGSEGQAILWIEDPAPQRTFDPGLPQWVGC